MTFSMKPQVAQQSNTSQVSDDDWKVWNDYYYNILDTKEQPYKDGEGNVVNGKFYKKKKLVGILNFIVDLGLQPQPDSSYEWKGKAGTGDDPSEYSDEELAHIQKYPDNYFRTVKGKRMQFKPEQPTQEFAFYFDFPKAEIDWSKHPIEELHSLGVKPLRVGYNGYFKDKKRGVEGLGKHLRFAPNYKTGKLSPKNPISKLAVAMGREAEFDKEYDFAALAGGSCFFEVFVIKTVTDKGAFYNTEIRNYSEITDMELPDGSMFSVKQQIPECDVEFTGVMLNGMEYSEDVLKMISHKKELMCSLPLATSFRPSPDKYPDFWLGCEWGKSDLYKAMLSQGLVKEVVVEDKHVANNVDLVAKAKELEDKPVEKEVPASKKAVVDEPEPNMDFDDD